MPRESKHSKLKRQFLSGKCDIAKLAIEYLESTEKLLFRRLRRSEITSNQYQFRIDEIGNIKIAIDKLQDKIKNLQDEIEKLKKENDYLHGEMNNLCGKFGLLQLYENKGELINGKNQEKLNILTQIRTIFQIYRNKYESDTVEADSSKIVEIIEVDKIEAGPSQIVAKTTFKELEIPEILGEIAFNLSPKDFSALLLTNKSIKYKLESHFFEYQNMWRNYFHRLFPKKLLKQEIYFLYSYKKCIHCDKEFDDPVIIFELKIKICRNCIFLALMSRRDFEGIYSLNKASTSLKNKIIKAINSVDFQQLQGSYLHFDFRFNPDLSHLLFYFKKDVDKFVKEFNQIPDNLINGWLEEKSSIVHEYQKNVLKHKHPLISDRNMEMMLSCAAFHVPPEYKLSDNLNTIFSNFL